MGSGFEQWRCNYKYMELQGIFSEVSIIGVKLCQDIPGFHHKYPITY